MDSNLMTKIYDTSGRFVGSINLIPSLNSTHWDFVIPTRLSIPSLASEIKSVQAETFRINLQLFRTEKGTVEKRWVADNFALQHLFR